MKLGGDPKKIGVLGGLLAVAAVVYFINSDSSEPSRPAAASKSAAVAPDAIAAGAPPVPSAVRRTASGRGAVGEFSPKPPATVDPSKVDPTIRLDLLAKVQAIDLEGGARNLFQFATPPQPKDPPKLPDVGKVAVNGTPVTPAPPPPPTPQPAPPPPPINLKYYGYSTKRADGEKKAFFLDGDEIIVASEGQMMKKRYKLVKIGVNSVQVEDTETKRTQTLPLQQEAAPA